jgi:glycosyltransferase involved in cell wall biosynthesis
VSEWPRLKQFLGELHVHGAGPEEPVIRDLIARNKWQNTIFCHGAYPQGKEYAQLMASYDLTLLPTIGAEGAPLVLLESMACGVPFVATDAGGIRDYDNPDCLITSATEPEEFLAAVEKITTRLARGEVDQPRLQQFYRSHFGHETLARKWLDMFNSLR